jgi:hypothetical protein
MSMREATRNGLAPILVGGVTLGWAAVLLLLARGGDSSTAQLTSNIGLTLISLVAGIAGIRRARDSGRLRRFWLLLGSASLSWSAGQAVSRRSRTSAISAFPRWRRSPCSACRSPPPASRAGCASFSTA